MKNLTYLKNLLYNEISAFDEKEDRYQELNYKIDLYLDLITILNQDIETIKKRSSLLYNLINEIYGSPFLSLRIMEIIGQIDESLQNQSSFQSELDTLNEIKQNLSDELQRLEIENEEICKYLKLVSPRKKLFVSLIYNLKKSQLVKEHHLDELKKLFEEKNMPYEDQICIFEHIKKHNDKARSRFSKVEREHKNEILEMLEFGFEIISDDSLDYDPRISKELPVCINLLKYYDDTNEFIKHLFDTYKESNLIQGLFIGLINHIQDNILEQRNMIKEKDFYVDSDLRDEICEEFNHQLLMYIKLRNYYDKVFESEEEIVDIEERTLVYATKESGEPYVYDDIKDFPEEYLDKLESLIKSFKEGNLTKKHIAGFTTNLHQYRKLKDDQIRVVIKQVAENIFCVLGLAVKKDQRSSAYNKICAREIPNNLKQMLLEKDEVEDNLFSYIKENHRKGNR